MALGALQVISMIVHFFLKPVLWKSSSRKIYYVLCIASLVTLAITFFTEIIKDSITLMAWMIPVTGGIAVYYMIICLPEIKKLQQ
ncbi:MAG: hypothetical protein EPN92_05595 [Chitinophagaceae bacterium]|nr:MAG: hypothetical protein EPN92_05595 [Chitinophagaceae bacterium]